MNDKILAILRGLRENPLKYTRTGSFDETAALLCGLDHATGNQALEGFQEWMTIQLKGDYSNTFWAISSLYVTFPESQGNPAFVPPRRGSGPKRPARSGGAVSYRPKNRGVGRSEKEISGREKRMGRMVRE